MRGAELFHELFSLAEVTARHGNDAEYAIRKIAFDALLQNVCLGGLNSPGSELR